MKTGLARGFCEHCALHLGSPPEAGFRALSGKAVSNEKKNEAVSIGS